MDLLDRLIDFGLDEDLGAAGDVTTQWLELRGQEGRRGVGAKEPMVIAGLDAFARVFRRVDGQLAIDLHSSDGQEVVNPSALASVAGRFGSLLKAERVALNLVQRTCGIATATRRAVQALSG